METATEGLRERVLEVKKRRIALDVGLRTGLGGLNQRVSASASPS
jgi:hypothetical protein